MTAIEIVLTITALVVLVLLAMVIDLREECSAMRAEIKYLDNCRKVLYDTLYEHLKTHIEKGEKNLKDKK